MAELTLHLVRHGETDWNRNGRIQGSTDIPLNPLGREQARGAAARLAQRPLGAVISSDLRRASETAAIIAAPQRLDVTLEPALGERGFGVLEGRDHAEVEAAFDADWMDVLASLDEHADGAESTRQHYNRVAAYLNRLLLHPPAVEAAIVCHGGTIRRALAYFRGGFEEEFRQAIDNASVHTITVEAGVVPPRRLDLEAEAEAVPSPSWQPAAEPQIGGGTAAL